MTRATRFRRLIVATLAAALAVSTVVPSVVAKDPNPNKKPKDPVAVQIRRPQRLPRPLEPLVATATGGGRIGALSDHDDDPATPTICAPATCLPAGGTEYLATHVAALKATNQSNTPVLAPRRGRLPRVQDYIQGFGGRAAATRNWRRSDITSPIWKS